MTRRSRVLTVLLLAAALLSPAGAARAECEGHVSSLVESYKSLHDNASSKSKPGMSSAVYKTLNAAQHRADYGQQSRALLILDSIPLDKISAAERSYVQSYYAFVYSNLNNFPRTIESYEALVLNESAPQSMVVSAFYTLSQLYYLQRDYCEAIRLADYYLVMLKGSDEDGISESVGKANSLIANAYMTLKDFKNSLSYADEAYSMMREAGKAVPETLYVTRYLGRMKLGDMDQAIESLESMKAAYPDSDKLVYLAWAYNKAGRMEESKATLADLVGRGIIDKDKYVLTLAEYLQGNNQGPEACALLREKFGDEAGSMLDNDSSLYAECFLVGD